MGLHRVIFKGKEVFFGGDVIEDIKSCIAESSEDELVKISLVDLKDIVEQIEEKVVDNQQQLLFEAETEFENLANEYDRQEAELQEALALADYYEEKANIIKIKLEEN